MAQPQQQREPSRPEDTHSPQPPQQREPSSPTLRRSHRTCKQRSMLNVDPSKKSYASIAALDLTEDTSLPLNPQLHHLLLTELGITDIQACKAALSDPDTLSYDQVLLDPDIEEWKKSAHKEITQLESKDTWVELPTSEVTSKILPGAWVFCHERAPTGIITKFKERYCVGGDLQEDIPETYAPVVSQSTIRLVLVFTLTKIGISSVWISTMPLSKRIQCGYIFPEDTDPSQPHLHVSDSRKASMVSQLHPSFGINIYNRID